MNALDAPPAALAAVHARIATIRALGGQGGEGLSFAAALSAATRSNDGGAGVRAASSLARAGATGDQAVALAMDQLGTPYVWGGERPGGFDCSGLVQYTYQQLGVSLPRVAADQARAGTPVASLDDAVPGDLVFFGSPIDHVGIYAGAGTMVVAPKRGDVVKVQPIASTPVAIRRVATPAAGFDDLFTAAEARNALPAGLLASVAKAESGLDPKARSAAGAVGLMQLMPSTAAGLGVDPLDPAQAVDGAARLLAGHLQRFGSVDLALAAYNAGPGAVTKAGGIPPFAETQTYVRRVLAGMGSR
jgi:cell wall-associated NlpC family hydrolase